MDRAFPILRMPHAVSTLQTFSLGAFIGQSHVLDIHFASARCKELRNVLSGVVGLSRVRAFLAARNLARRRLHSRRLLFCMRTVTTLVFALVVKMLVTEIVLVARNKIISTIM